jgi:lysozyme
MDVNLKVLDLSHHNVGQRGGTDPIDLDAIAAFGIRGIIHKASEGVAVVDPMHDVRRAAALDAGLLWGSYHFATEDDVDAQVKHFLNCAQPDSRTLMALDHEPNPEVAGGKLDLHGAQAFLESLRDQIGRMPVIYSGNLIKEQTAQDASLNDFFGSFRYWLCEYAPHAVVPTAWKVTGAWLWQFSGDGVANRGITVPGVLHGNAVDMNAYPDSDEDLAAQWA